MKSLRFSPVLTRNVYRVYLDEHGCIWRDRVRDIWLIRQRRVCHGVVAFFPGYSHTFSTSTVLLLNMLLMSGSWDFQVLPLLGCAFQLFPPTNSDVFLRFLKIWSPKQTSAVWVCANTSMSSLEPISKASPSDWISTMTSISPGCARPTEPSRRMVICGNIPVQDSRHGSPGFRIYSAQLPANFTPSCTVQRDHQENGSLGTTMIQESLEERKLLLSWVSILSLSCTDTPPSSSVLRFHVCGRDARQKGSDEYFIKY